MSNVSPRTRFEIFKRDKFTCQYCGKKPPTVILHADHILPVSKGGTSERTNLITACDTCNLGKSNVLLESVIEPIQKRLQEDIERAEQVAQYNKWLKKLRKSKEVDFRMISDAIMEACGEAPGTKTVSGPHANSIRMFIDRLPAEEVLRAVQIADSRKPFNKNSSYTSFKYFCGVCWSMVREFEGTE